MDDHRLLAEAQDLEKRLFCAWDNAAHTSDYAARLVGVAERARKRHLRRSARCGDQLAQRWLTLLEKAISQ